jgi:hypothetical protein
MQSPAASIFWSLLLAHFLGAFPLQTASIRQSKRRLLWRGYLQHGLILFSLTWTSLAVFTAIDASSVRSLAIVLALVAGHLISDWAECIFGRLRKMERPRVFLAHQLCHLLIIAVAGAILAGWSWSATKAALSAVHGSPKLLPALAIYAGAIFAGGHLVRNLTKPLLDGFTELSDGRTESVRQLNNAGLYIGWLERFLVISALALQSPATVGLILTAKSIVRFPELKDLRFAEYFLIGTLLSMSIALADGMLLVSILYGSLSLK